MTFDTDSWKWKTQQLFTGRLRNLTNGGFDINEAEQLSEEIDEAVEQGYELVGYEATTWETLLSMMEKELFSEMVIAGAQEQ